MLYDYREAVKNDIIDYINDNVEFSDYIDRDDLQEKLYDELWISDNVTGNASGSYTFNTYEAGLNLAGNFDLLGEAFDAFGYDGDAFRQGEETLDVIIRCYLISECLQEALEDLEDELSEAYDEE